MPAPLPPLAFERIRSRPRLSTAGLLACTLLLTLSSCGAEARRVRQALAHENAQLVHAALPDQAQTSLDRAAREAVALRAAAADLALGRNSTARPLLTAREAWTSARDAWVSALPFTAMAGALLPGTDLPDPDRPLPDPGWFDAVDGDADAGVISDPGQDLKAELFRSAQAGTSDRARIGWEPLAFLLFGEDTRVDYHGSRPLEDFNPESEVGEHVSRRLLALRLQADLLAEMVAEHAALWAEGGRARGAFAEADAVMVLPLFAEVTAQLLAERVRRALPLDDGDARRESSAYADSNRADLLALARGLKAAQRGAADGEISGSGLQIVTQRVDDQLAMAVVRSLDAAARQSRNLPEHFDATLEPSEVEGEQREAAAKAWRRARFQLRLQAELFALGKASAES